MDTYEKKHKEEVVRATQLWERGDITRENLEYIFPELKESEDEKVKRILHSISSKMIFHRRDIFTEEEFQCFDAWSIAWLEKQGEKPKKVSIWKHWKDGIAGGAEGEQIFLTKIGSVYSISSCLGCECDYIELSELDKLMREDGFDAELNALLKKYEHLPKEEVAECLNFYIKVVQGEQLK